MMQRVSKTSAGSGMPECHWLSCSRMQQNAEQAFAIIARRMASKAGLHVALTEMSK